MHRSQRKRRRNVARGSAKSKGKERADPRDALKALVYSLTKPTPGRTVLTKNELNEMKNLCRASETNVRTAFTFVMEMLRKDNSQARLLALRLVAYFFARSELFRSLCVSRIRDIVDLTIGPTQSTRLPGPANMAALLRETALELVECWKEKYSYGEIRLAFRYLKVQCQMKFPEVNARAAQRQREEQERKEHADRLLSVKYEKLRQEFGEVEAEMISNLSQMRECFHIIIPDILEEWKAPTSTNIEDVLEGDDWEAPNEDSDVEWENGQDSDDEDAESESTLSEERDESELLSPGQKHLVERGTSAIDLGLGTSGYELEVSIAPQQIVQENADNAPLFAAIADSMHLLENKHIPLIRDWEEVLTRVPHNSQSDKAAKQKLLLRVIDLKNGMLDALKKANNIQGSSIITRGSESIAELCRTSGEQGSHRQGRKRRRVVTLTIDEMVDSGSSDSKRREKQD